MNTLTEITMQVLQRAIDVRTPTPDEIEAICRALCTDPFNPMELDELCIDSIVLISRYTTDGPGYSGPVAFCLFTGAPELHAVLTLDKGFREVPEPGPIPETANLESAQRLLGSTEAAPDRSARRPNPGEWRVESCQSVAEVGLYRALKRMTDHFSYDHVGGNRQMHHADCPHCDAHTALDLTR